MGRTAKVYVQRELAGQIRETEEGYEFEYRAEYLSDPSAVAISLTLPLSQETYRSNTLFPFFDGLIPEGWLLGLVERNWKIDRRDRFGLMLVSCRDCIGDVSVEEELP